MIELIRNTNRTIIMNENTNNCKICQAPPFPQGPTICQIENCPRNKTKSDSATCSETKKATNRMRITLTAMQLYGAFSRSQITPLKWEALPKDEQDRWRECAVKAESLNTKDMPPEGSE